MTREPSPEIDDELFNEVYGKAYTGPPLSNPSNAAPKGDSNKRPLSGSQSDEDNEAPDPNAVPTDFTSREAKVWEAKAKATERNWKKRKEEEMICKICGESGHFTQGCPSTLGTSRKSAEVFERVPARDKNVRALFTVKVINQIEKDVGCNIKMDEKFLIVSGKDRLILAKGVDAVHKIIQDDKGRQKSPANSNRAGSRSPDRSPRGSHFRRSESQSKRSHPSPRNTSRSLGRGFNHERSIEEQPRRDLHKVSRDTPQAKAYGNEDGKVRPTRSRSPLRPHYSNEKFRTYDGHNHNAGVHTPNNWVIERRGQEPASEHKFGFSTYPQSLEELEMSFKRDAFDIERIHNQEEDDENYKHREFIRDLRENYLKKLEGTRLMHRRQWEEFLQLDMRRRQQEECQSYNQPAYPDYDQSSRNVQYGRSSLPMEPKDRYQISSDNYGAPRPHDSFGEFQRQRHEDFGTYRRY